MSNTKIARTFVYLALAFVGAPAVLAAASTKAAPVGTVEIGAVVVTSFVPESDANVIALPEMTITPAE